MNVDPRVPLDDIAQFKAAIDNLRERVRNLEAPTGTAVFQAVAKLTDLVNNINATLTAYINAYSYTKAQIDARVTNPAISGNVSTSAAFYSSSSGRFDGGLASNDIYNHLVTYGSYRATWTNIDGTVGYAPSSRQFKTGIRDVELDMDAIGKLRIRTFQYLAPVPYGQEQQKWEVGLIAEEVHDLGLTWLVDYDENGKPFGIRYDLLGLAIAQLGRLNG